MDHYGSEGQRLITLASFHLGILSTGFFVFTSCRIKIGIIVTIGTPHEYNNITTGKKQNSNKMSWTDKIHASWNADASGGSKVGARGTPHSGSKFFQFHACSFWENLAKSYVGAPSPLRVGVPTSGKSRIHHWMPFTFVNGTSQNFWFLFKCISELIMCTHKSKIGFTTQNEQLKIFTTVKFAKRND